MDPFIAEIRIFAGNFAPRGWATCDGQLLPISQNTALFSLLGTMYGGNGTSNFALPNMQGSVPIHTDDQNPQGATGGSDSVTLLETEIASHTHNVNVNAADSATLTQPGPQVVISRSSGGPAYQRDTTNNLVRMAQQTITTGISPAPHNNLQPYLTLTFIIALQGVYPQRG
jgi:microcystin-dependent protein